MKTRDDSMVHCSTVTRKHSACDEVVGRRGSFSDMLTRSSSLHNMLPSSSSINCVDEDELPTNGTMRYSVQKQQRPRLERMPGGSWDKKSPKNANHLQGNEDDTCDDEGDEDFGNADDMGSVCREMAAALFELRVTETPGNPSKRITSTKNFCKQKASTIGHSVKNVKQGCKKSLSTAKSILHHHEGDEKHKIRIPRNKLKKKNERNINSGSPCMDENDVFDKMREENYRVRAEFLGCELKPKKRGNLDYLDIPKAPKDEARSHGSKKMRSRRGFEHPLHSSDAAGKSPSKTRKLLKDLKSAKDVGSPTPGSSSPQLDKSGRFSPLSRSPSNIAGRLTPTRKSRRTSRRRRRCSSIDDSARSSLWQESEMESSGTFSLERTMDSSGTISLERSGMDIMNISSTNAEVFCSDGEQDFTPLRRSSSDGDFLRSLLQGVQLDELGDFGFDDLGGDSAKNLFAGTENEAFASDLPNYARTESPGGYKNELAQRDFHGEQQGFDWVEAPLGEDDTDGPSPKDPLLEPPKLDMPSRSSRRRCSSASTISIMGRKSRSQSKKSKIGKEDKTPLLNTPENTKQQKTHKQPKAPKPQKSKPKKPEKLEKHERTRRRGSLVSTVLKPLRKNNGDTPSRKMQRRNSFDGVGSSFDHVPLSLDSTNHSVGAISRIRDFAETFDTVVTGAREHSASFAPANSNFAGVLSDNALLEMAGAEAADTINQVIPQFNKMHEAMGQQLMSRDAIPVQRNPPVRSLSKINSHRGLFTEALQRNSERVGHPNECDVKENLAAKWSESIKEVDHDAFLSSFLYSV